MYEGENPDGYSTGHGTLCVSYFNFRHNDVYEGGNPDNYFFLQFDQRDDSSIPLPVTSFLVTVARKSGGLSPFSCLAWEGSTKFCLRGEDPGGVARVTASRTAEVLDDLGVRGGNSFLTDIHKLT